MKREAAEVSVKPTVRHVKYDPRHSALLVIDLQNDFVSPAGGLARLGVDLAPLREMLRRAVQLVADARQEGVKIIYVRHVNSDDASSPPILEKRGEQGRDRVPVVWKGSWGAALAPELDARAEDIVLEKTRFDGFLNTDLDCRLRALGIQTVVLSGLSTNVCVDSTARAAFMRDYFVLIPEDCVAASIRHLHAPALETLARYFVTVTRADALVSEWRAFRSP